MTLRSLTVMSRWPLEYIMEYNLQCMLIWVQIESPVGACIHPMAPYVALAARYPIQDNVRIVCIRRLGQG